MKTINVLLLFCVVLFLADYTFVAAQEKIDGISVNQIENRKTKVEMPPSNTAAKTEIGSNDSVGSYKNQTREKYRIGFQDTIEVQFTRHPELSQVVNVSPDGTIVLARIKNPIVAACKTERELSETIIKEYKTIFRDPYISVRTVEQRSQPVAVVGAVKKAGNFFLNRKTSLLELLAWAGGPDVEFAGSKIQIARTGNFNGCEANSFEEKSEENLKFISYNLNDILKGKDNPVMQPGDIVSVLIAEEAYVVGNVLKPTKIILNEPKTLTQALAAASGTDKTANTEKVIIQRHDPLTGIKKELVFNLKDIREQKIPDPQIQANDIVHVSNDKVKGFIKGVTNIITNTIPTGITRVP